MGGNLKVKGRTSERKEPARRGNWWEASPSCGPMLRSMRLTTPSSLREKCGAMLAFNHTSCACATPRASAAACTRTHPLLCHRSRFKVLLQKMLLFDPAMIGEPA